MVKDPLPASEAARESVAADARLFIAILLFAVFGLTAWVLSPVSTAQAPDPRSVQNSTSHAVTAEKTLVTSVTAQPAHAQSDAAEAPLELIATRGYEEYGYNIVEGQVRNVSGSPLSGVAAVSTWFTTDREFVRADTAIIDYDPILPGQTATFKTIGHGNPEAKKYTVAFKFLLGGEIATNDARHSSSKRSPK